MKKYAIKHKEGFLVKSIGYPFVDISTNFSSAMTFSSKKAAEETARYLNDVTVRNGGKIKNCYSVCERSKFTPPAWAKKKI